MHFTWTVLTFFLQVIKNFNSQKTKGGQNETAWRRYRDHMGKHYPPRPYKQRAIKINRIKERMKES